MNCEYIYYLANFDEDPAEFEPVLCEQKATQVFVRTYPSNNPRLLGPINVCDEHALESKHENTLYGAIENGEGW